MTRSSRDRDHTWPAVLAWAGLLAIVAGGCALRLQTLSATQIGSDEVHPLLAVYDLLRWRVVPTYGEAAGFHYGVFQSLLQVPLMVVARDLVQYYALLAVLQGLGGLALGLAGKILRGWGVGLAAATLYAAWPVLVLHGTVPSYTYLAPPLVALAVLGVASTLVHSGRVGPFLAAVALAMAVNMHPYALATAAATVAVVPAAIRRHGGTRIALAAGLGLLFLLPMIVDNAAVVLGDLRDMGRADVLGQGRFTAGQVLRSGVLSSTSFWPTWVVPLLWALPAIALVRRVLPSGRANPTPDAAIVGWAVLAYLLLWGIGCLLHYQYTYHAAVVAPVHALAGALGIAALGDLLRARWQVWAGSAAWIAVLALAVLGRGQPQRHLIEVSAARIGFVGRVAEAVERDARGEPVTLAVLLDTRADDPVAIQVLHAELWMRGVNVVEKPWMLDVYGRPPRGYVLASLDVETWPAMIGHTEVLLDERGGRGARIQVLAFEGRDQAARWLGQVCPVRDDWPFVGLSDPEASLGGVAWTDWKPDQAWDRSNLDQFCEAYRRAGGAAPWIGDEEEPADHRRSNVYDTAPRAVGSPTDP